MKSTLITIALLLFGSAAFGQQTTTNTNCYVNGQQVDCTSTSTNNSATQAQQAETQRELNEAGTNLGAAIGTTIARNKAEHAEEERVLMNIVYCQQNPEGSVTVGQGKLTQSCSVELAKARAVCTVKNKYKFCKVLAAPLSPAPTAAIQVSTPSAPTSSPVSVAATSAPELTPEQKDAASYCQRNPTATITKTDGTVIPCATVSGNSR